MVVAVLAPFALPLIVTGLATPILMVLTPASIVRVPFEGFAPAPMSDSVVPSVATNVAPPDPTVMTLAVVAEELLTIRLVPSLVRTPVGTLVAAPIVTLPTLFNVSAGAALVLVASSNVRLVSKMAALLIFEGREPIKSV